MEEQFHGDGKRTCPGLNHRKQFLQRMESSFSFPDSVFLFQTLKTVSEFKVKVDQEKVLKCLELLNYLIKTMTQQVGKSVTLWELLESPSFV